MRLENSDSSAEYVSQEIQPLCRTQHRPVPPSFQPERRLGFSTAGGSRDSWRERGPRRQGALRRPRPHRTDGRGWSKGRSWPSRTIGECKPPGKLYIWRCIFEDTPHPPTPPDDSNHPQPTSFLSLHNWFSSRRPCGKRCSCRFLQETSNRAVQERLLFSFGSTLPTPRLSTTEGHGGRNVGGQRE